MVVNLAKATLRWSDFQLEIFVHVRSRCLHTCLRTIRWAINNVYRLLINGLTRLHDAPEKSFDEYPIK